MCSADAKHVIPNYRHKGRKIMKRRLDPMIQLRKQASPSIIFFQIAYRNFHHNWEGTNRRQEKACSEQIVPFKTPRYRVKYCKKSIPRVHLKAQP